MYKVHYDPRTRVIEAELAGFLAPDEVAGYVKDVQTVAILNRLHHGYRLLIDLSGCAIQSQETLAALARHMAVMPRAERIAVVVGDTPGAGQARRLFTQPYARLVSDRAAALAWLDDPRA